MIKFGICTPEQLIGDRLSRLLPIKRFVAISLYETIAQASWPCRDELLSRILISFPTRTGAFKWTEAQRFGEFDEAVAILAKTRLSGRGEVTILDVGVSDGRTAVDLFRQLEMHGPKPYRYVASDYSPDVTIVCEPGRRGAIVLDPLDHTLLQVVYPPFVFNIAKHESPILFPINRIILRYLLSTLVRRLTKRFNEGSRAVEVRNTFLVHPDCLALMKEHGNFTFVRLDARERVPFECDVVRAMNVLNRGYFGDTELCRIFSQFHRAIRKGGLFVVGANSGRGTEVKATVYIRTDSGFERIHRVGGGAEVEPLVGGVLGRDTANPHAS